MKIRQRVFVASFTILFPHIHDRTSLNVCDMAAYECEQSEGKTYACKTLTLANCAKDTIKINGFDN